ncbi:hypothetical protein [uncultured Bacteroides sp.]|uniref:hypothetical protein n=1 Tax=uncultured Bacteroides sp. TaxID=162156 RepID=UPI002617D1AF|nr:hypothetical protein [uncultured Bacteroides sp.]
MKSIIEFNSSEDNNILDATFSITITDIKVGSREVLKELPDLVRDAYLNFLKMYLDKESVEKIEKLI